MSKINLVYFADSKEGACFQYRIQHPIQFIDHSRFAPEFNEKWEPKYQQSGDIFTFQRNSTKDAIQILYQLSKRKRATIYDMDDDIFQIPETNPVYELYLHNPSVPWHQVVGMRYATALTVSCDRLKQVYSHINPNIHVLPNCLGSWDDVYPILRENGRVRLFWGGSPTHTDDLDIIRDVLDALYRKHGKEIEIVIMGSDKERFKCPVTQIPFGPYSFFQGVMASCDIGLAPMTSSIFNLGKSDLRLKELGAAGLPIVASNFGEYKKEDSGALLCETKNEWFSNMDKLITDETFRSSRAKMSNEWAMGWTIDHHIHLWENLYEEILDGSTRRSSGKGVAVQDRKRSPNVPRTGKVRVGNYALGGDNLNRRGSDSWVLNNDS